MIEVVEKVWRHLGHRDQGGGEGITSIYISALQYFSLQSFHIFFALLKEGNLSWSENGKRLVKRVEQRAVIPKENGLPAPKFASPPHALDAPCAAVQ
jgi:hypothetical protein